MDFRTGDRPGFCNRRVLHLQCGSFNRHPGGSRDPASLISRNAALDPGFRRGDGVVERHVKYQEIGRLRSKGNDPFSKSYFPR
jgi:hypothetical protein